MRVPTSANLRWLWLAVLVVALDQLTKHLIVASFRPGEELPLTPFASLILAFNRGAAFSFLAGETGWQRWLFAAIAVAACAVMAWLLARGGRALFCAGLALIIGGALGNLYDRLTLGHVVDFVLLHWRGWYYPAFNVADSAITIGAAALILDSFRRPREAPGSSP
ncbi:MAG TPA: signal peptidase II [Casimicrobiaceae bacterium]|nr:signal peptidase II [Casimicrobiaceae bacterium]